MCGIFGIVTRSRGESSDLLKRALDSLQHRGPDDSGTCTIRLAPEPGHIGLAHTRLSIIDLSSLGHQPMHDPATGNWIIFNGEIYNFRELRSELAQADVEFKSESDTEVMLAAYRVWGESFVNRLGGMFAFALWDARQQQLLLARDPLGIKPLYYHQTEKAFLFASEVRTLLQTGLVARKLDSTGLLTYLTFGSVSEPWTIVEGAKAVPPGHTLTLRNGSTSIREYWNPLTSAAEAKLDPSESAEAIAALPAVLRDAVMSHLVGDVPVGVFLSGGIDSSALVAVLSQNGVRANTFSLVFKEEEFDEGRYSRVIARHFLTEHQEIEISAHDALLGLPAALSAMDQPTIDGVNTYLVSAKTRAAGIKVALTGLGADEVFAGYSNFRRVPRMERFWKQFERLPNGVRSPLSGLLAMFAGRGDRPRKLAELTSGIDSMVHPYFLMRALFGEAQRAKLFVSPDYAGSRHSLAQQLQAAVDESRSLDPVNRVSYLESRFYMRNTLLRDADFMSMAHGLELRVPFLDRALVETCFRIPGVRKVAGDVPKGLLLESLGVDLPPDIVRRRKRGFTLPLENWMRGEMRPFVESVLLSGDSGHGGLDRIAIRDVWNRFLTKQTSWSRPWSLFVFARWCEQNL